MSVVEKKKVKALGLLSGGLDSTLATRIMQRLGFDITILNFTSPFCTCTRQDHGCKSEAKRLSDELGLPVRVEFMGKEYMDVVKNPEHGYGQNMNPCIDCRLLMFRRAKEIMEEVGASFLFTGEVVGQRPMSQRRDRMHMIEKRTGLSGLIVRPLCAKLFPPTIPEKEGIIDRETMLGIHGRSRKEQIKIAKEEFGMTENLCSSGGCLLTDPSFSKRIKDLVDNDASASIRDTRFLRLGRHFRLSDDLKIIVGRDEGENEKLNKMAKDEDFVFYPIDTVGPMSVVKGKIGRDSVELIGSITARYCKGANGVPVKIGYGMKGGDTSFSLTVCPIEEEKLEALRV